MKLFQTFILFFLVVNCFSQTNTEDKQIHFRHYNSIILGSEIIIKIFPNHKKENYFNVEVKTSEYFRRYKIKESTFLEVWSAIIKIAPSDLMQVERHCLDGGTTEIELYKDVGTVSIKYSVHCMSSQDDKTAWKDYLNAVKLILEVAKLNYSDLK